MRGTAKRLQDTWDRRASACWVLWAKPVFVRKACFLSTCDGGSFFVFAEPGIQLIKEFYDPLEVLLSGCLPQGTASIHVAELYFFMFGKLFRTYRFHSDLSSFCCS